VPGAVAVAVVAVAVVAVAVVAAVAVRAGAVLPQCGLDTLSAELIARCRDQLASYKKPRRVIYVDALPHNALGKVQKHVLREWIEAGQLAPSGPPNT